MTVRDVTSHLPPSPRPTKAKQNKTKQNKNKNLSAFSARKITKIIFRTHHLVHIIITNSEGLQILSDSFNIFLSSFQFNKGVFFNNIQQFPLTHGDTFQDPQEVPETPDSAESCTCVFSTYILCPLQETVYGFSLAYSNCQITILALWGHH